jgi:hypothetical protein
MTPCPKCDRQWPDTSEQAAAVRLYQRCIVCCVEAEKSEGFDWSVESVITEAVIAKMSGEATCQPEKK